MAKLTPSEIVVLNSDLDALEEKRQGLAESINRRLQKLTEHNCPFVVGQIIVNENGQRARVENVRSEYDSRTEWTLTIQKIKKDGTPHQKRTRYYSWENWKAE
ncbi:MAG: hypothetical protein KAS30_01735 [Candidatus Diapherotrites archaeon]|nr:hypothetical protein [Candidatus Diapherotrites archaeon]